MNTATMHLADYSDLLQGRILPSTPDNASYSEIYDVEQRCSYAIDGKEHPIRMNTLHSVTIQPGQTMPVTLKQVMLIGTPLKIGEKIYHPTATMTANSPIFPVLVIGWILNIGPDFNDSKDADIVVYVHNPTNTTIYIPADSMLGNAWFWPAYTEVLPKGKTDD